MSQETTGIPTKYPLPPMRLRDWVYGLLAMGIVAGITCGLWYAVAMALTWLVSLA